MEVIFHENFYKSSKKLPQSQQVKMAKLIETLRENPYHSILHTKQLSGKFAGFHSFRITRDYRAIFIFIAKNTIQLVDVGNRKDIYE